MIHEKRLIIANHQGIANQIHNEAPPIPASKSIKKKDKSVGGGVKKSEHSYTVNGTVK